MPRAATEAENLLEDLGLNCVPVIPRRVCEAMSSEQYQITIEAKPLTSGDFQGVSMGDDNGAAILINSNISNRHRKRFTEAHELGHVHLHIQTNMKSQFQCTARDISSGTSSNDGFEREANEFASSLLMPSATVSPVVGKKDLSWSLIEEVRMLCDVSLEAAARRVIAVSKESCCLIIHKNGKMWYSIKSKAFNAFLPTQVFPSYLHTDPDIAGDQSFPTSMDECDFSDWSFPNSASNGKLYYSSIHNQEFDRTMSLILHQEDDMDDDSEWGDPHF